MNLGFEGGGVCVSGGGGGGGGGLTSQQPAIKLEIRIREILTVVEASAHLSSLSISYIHLNFTLSLEQE